MAKRQGAKVVKGARNDARKNGKASKTGVKHSKNPQSALNLVLMNKGLGHRVKGTIQRSK